MLFNSEKIVKTENFMLQIIKEMIKEIKRR